MLNLKESPLILTFFLLSQNKGIENMHKALPEVINQYPDFVYLILGATHPMIKKKYGEAYRQYLKNIVSELEIENNVIFHDKFVEKEELCNIIRENAYYFGRKMTWKNVAEEYTTVFHKTLNDYITYPKIQNIFNFLPSKLPEVKIDQLKLLTDDMSIIQHSYLDVLTLHHKYNTDYGSRGLSSDPKKSDF